MMTATPTREDDEHASSGAPSDRQVETVPPAPLPLARLVGLLTTDFELDARWGARRQGERIPFCKPLALSRVEVVEPDADSSGSLGMLAMDVETIFEGWALNICHGGLRVITEETLRVGDFLGIEVTSSCTRYAGKARVCWVRTEADGVIAGLQFSFLG